MGRKMTTGRVAESGNGKGTLRCRGVGTTMPLLVLCESQQQMRRLCTKS